MIYFIRFFDQSPCRAPRGPSFLFNLAILTFILLVTGCASIGQKWKQLISSDSSAQKTAAPAAAARSLTFNDQNQMLPTQNRQYRRVNRKNFDEGASLQARSGSLWVMEGQGAYLFAENTVRMIGDPITVRLEGEPREQLVAKADVIANLMKQLEERRKRASSRSAGGANSQKAGDDSPQAEPELDPAPNNSVENRAPASNTESGNLSVKAVPTRVVERMIDGNYRVRGTQPFMIGSREYRVIVSGIVRAEDFNEQGVSASQLLDSSFDIVSAKGAELRL